MQQGNKRYTKYCPRFTVKRFSVPAKDIYHDSVKNALIKDEWTITHDPLTLKVGRRDLFIDLGAEKFLAAEKQGRKIAVEVKSFISASEVEDLSQCSGSVYFISKCFGTARARARIIFSYTSKYLCRIVRRSFRSDLIRQETN